jgi:MYXO-CTERM domain-containing protein
MRKAAILALTLASAFTSFHARADTCLGSVDDFNAFMDTQIVSATSVTLDFTVTGVNLDDYFNGKGWLAELADTRCTGGGTASLKVYGTSSPLNTAHPPGTLKLEYGSFCCAAQTCPVEYWASPMPGDQVFSQPSQVCAVRESLTATTVAYDVQCDGGATFHADGPNTDGMTITRAAVLREVAGGHAMTNATASNVNVCFELAPPPANVKIVSVVEDVTVAPQYPTTVYPDATDLACGAGDGTAYLAFDLSSVGGSISSAKLFVHSAADASAAGMGADVDVVADATWSESSLVWNARPALGSRIARIDGVSPDLWYSVDVSAALSKPARYAFALAPSSSDTNTAHFMSKEASATLRPYLLVETTDAGPPITTDAGAPPSPSGDASNKPNAPLPDSESASGCGVAPARSDDASAIAALALFAFTRRRRLASPRATAPSGGASRRDRARSGPPGE